MAYGRGKGGCVDSCIKCVITTLNVIVMIVGLGIAAVGGLAAFRPQLLTKLVDVFDFLKNAIPSFDGGELEGADIVGYLRPFGIVFLVFGIVVAVIGLIGCCGACCKIRVLLIIYSALIVIIMLCVVAIVVAYFGFKDELSEKLKDKLETKLQEDYRGDDDTHVEEAKVSVLVTAINRKFKCCGINNAEDFNKATKWNRTVILSEKNIANFQHPTEIVTGLVTPLSCCKYEGEFPDDKITTKAFAKECSDARRTEENSNYNKGCYDEVLKRYEEPTFFMVIGVIIFFLILLIVLVFVIYLARSDSGKSKPI